MGVRLSTDNLWQHCCQGSNTTFHHTGLCLNRTMRGVIIPTRQFMQWQKKQFFWHQKRIIITQHLLGHFHTEKLHHGRRTKMNRGLTGFCLLLRNSGDKPLNVLYFYPFFSLSLFYRGESPNCITYLSLWENQNRELLNTAHGDFMGVHNHIMRAFNGNPLFLSSSSAITKTLNFSHYFWSFLNRHFCHKISSKVRFFVFTAFLSENYH